MALNTALYSNYAKSYLVNSKYKIDLIGLTEMSIMTLFAYASMSIF